MYGAKMQNAVIFHISRTKITGRSNSNHSGGLPLSHAANERKSIACGFAME
jgi:hypothetical protein